MESPVVGETATSPENSLESKGNAATGLASTPARPKRGSRRVQHTDLAASAGSMSDEIAGSSTVQIETAGLAPALAAAATVKARKRGRPAAAAGANTPEIIESGLPRGPHSKRAPKHAATGSTSASSEELVQEQVAAPTGLSAELIVTTEAIVGVMEKQQKVKQPRATKAKAASAALAPGLTGDTEATVGGQEQQLKPKRQRGKKAKGEDMQGGPTVIDHNAGDKGSLQKKRRRAAEDNLEEAVAQQDEKEQEAAKPRKARARKAKAEPKTGDEGGEALPSQEGEVEVKKAPRKRIERGTYDIPTWDILPGALEVEPSERPVPNLGYACLNMTLREMKPPVFTNRDCIQATFHQKGLPYISSLALENSRALAAIIKWNNEQGIRFFRLSSGIFPWCTEYAIKDLPDYEAIVNNLAFAGELARAYHQRLTFHPSHFIKLGTDDEELVKKSIKELEVHSAVRHIPTYFRPETYAILDLMGYPPSHWNKINIHVGGVYGDKQTTLERFAANFRRLSPALQARLTVENDDVASSYSITDLLPLHNMTGIPLVFDFHHYKFCPGDLSLKDAFLAALKTWPAGIRPVVHWSESQEGRKAHAHSDYVSGPMNFFGLEKDIDVMIEAKHKELALLKYREIASQKPSEADELAFKLM